MTDRRQILMRQESIRRSLERSLRVRVATELRYTAKTAANAYPEWDSAIAGHVLRMGSILEQFYLKALKMSARHVQAAVIKAGIIRETKADTLGDLMRAWARREAAKKVVEIGQTTRDRIRRAIDKGLIAPEGERSVAEEIVRMTGGAIASSRALTIARTESHGAAQAGGMMAAKELDVVTTKEWIAAEDERTRETHDDADGQTVGIDEPFIVGGEELQYPGDPSGSADEVINCRCVIAYGVKAMDAVAAQNEEEEP